MKTNVDIQNIRCEIQRTRAELQQAEEMMKHVEPAFLDSQYLLIESLRSKINALVTQAKEQIGA